MKQIMQSFRLIVIVCVLWTGTPVQANEQVFTVSVVPQFASSQIYRNWTPFLRRLEQLTGYHFKLLAYDKFARFEKEFGAGIPDLIFLNPYHLVIAKQRQNYQPLVRDSAPLSGILVVRQNSPVKILADLNGKTIAFPSPNALGASLYMRALLTKEQHIKFTPVYTGSHQNVYRQVLLGDVAAGGGVNKTLKKEPEALRSQLKVLYRTPEIASHPLAAHPRVKSAVRKQIIAAMLAMNADPQDKKLLAAIQMPQPVEANYQRDYASLEKLRLDHYYEHEHQAE